MKKYLFWLIFMVIFSLSDAFSEKQATGIPVDTLFSYMKENFNVTVIYSSSEIEDDFGKVITIGGLDLTHLEKSNRMNQDFMMNVIVLSTGFEFKQVIPDYYVLKSSHKVLSDEHIFIQNQLATLTKTVYDMYHRVGLLDRLREDVNSLNIKTDNINKKTDYLLKIKE